MFSLVKQKLTATNFADLTWSYSGFNVKLKLLSLVLAIVFFPFSIWWLNANYLDGINYHI